MDKNILDIYVDENNVKGKIVYPNMSFVVAFETDDDEDPPPLYTFQIKKNIVYLTTTDSYTFNNNPIYFIQFSNVGSILHNNNADDNICTFDNNKFQSFIETIIINKALKILNKLKTIGCDLTKNTTCYNDLFLKISKKTYSTESLLHVGHKIGEKQRFLNYWKSAASVKDDNKYIINSNVNLIMRYFRNNDGTYSLDFGYAYVKSVAPTKKSLVTPDMEQIINTKLNITPSCVKDLFTIDNSSNPVDLSIDIGHAVLEIYAVNPPLPDSLKLNNLKTKPYTLLAKDNVHTYLNIFLSMLDKPHDIIGGRVSKANQIKLLSEIIIPNIKQYIDYINKLEIMKDQPIIKNFVTFITTMILSFEKTKQNKNFTTDISYENAILYLICKYYSTSGEGLSISTPAIPAGITSQLFQLNNLVPLPNIVINPDIMNLTQEIKSKVNHVDEINKKFRHYFSAPEVIDHGHVYDISNNTIIEFPENYKEIQLLLNNTKTEYVAIHSYSTTTNEPLVGGEPNLYYNIYVWFTKNTITTPTTTTPPQLFFLTKYKIPFNHAPDCSKVYENYCNNLLTPLNDIFTNLNNLINNAINKIYTTPPTDPLITKTIKHLILDQIFNAKSLQDDQNQLQVNQLQTSIALPIPVNKDTTPTQFIGLCTDLASAANGINYYMSNPNRNPHTMVAYYHRVKKIWANNNRIYMDNSKSKANKTAAKDIYQIVQEVLAKKGGTIITKRRKIEPQPPTLETRTKRKEIEPPTPMSEQYEQNKKIKNNNYDPYPEYTETSLIEETSLNNERFNTQRKEEIDESDPEFIQTEYNIMYDILYDKQDSTYEDFEELFKPITITNRDNHHYYFEIFSNDFMTVFNDRFKKIIDSNLKNLPSARVMINVLANYLLSDENMSGLDDVFGVDNKNIFFAPDNAFGVDRSIDGQIELSDKLDSDYDTLKKRYEQKLQAASQAENVINLETSTSSPVTAYGGSKTRKKTNKQKKNKTNKKKNNKNKTNKKRVYRIFRKTKKI
jgi:hypothetical protein